VDHIYKKRNSEDMSEHKMKTKRDTDSILVLANTYSKFLNLGIISGS